MSTFIFRIFRSYTTFCLFALISALCFSSLGKCKKLVDKFYNASLFNHMVMMCVHVRCQSLKSTNSLSSSKECDGNCGRKPPFKHEGN